MFKYLKSFISKEDDFEVGPKLLISGKLQNDEEIPNLEEVDEEEEIEESEETKFESSDPSNLSPNKPVEEKQAEASFHFIEHTVGIDDNLFGIALTYSINPGVIKRDNDVGDDVFPGMVLKIRVRDEVPVPEPSEENVAKLSCYSQETPEKPVQKALKTRIRAKTDSPNKLLPSLRVEKLVVFYSTNIGDVEGTLYVEGLQLVFVPTEFAKSPRKRRNDPNMSPEMLFSDQEAQRMRLGEWKVEINIEDIAECNVVVLPSASCEDHFDLNNEFEKDYLLQFIFYTHGQRSMGKYIDDVFTGLREKKVPYACVYFKVKNLIDQEHEYTNKQKTVMVHQLQAKIKTTKKQIEETNTETTTLTQLPYFELIFEKFQKTDADLLRKITKKENSPLKKKEFFGIVDQPQSPDQQKERPLGNILPLIVNKRMNYKILDESHILSPEQFNALIDSTPRLYQTLEWQLLYSTVVHGTSFAHMLRRTQENTPLLIVIKDENDFVFGAYSTNDLWFSEEFYGGGETFLFTFRDLDEITTFNWSKKNSLFLFVSEEGFMFGGGPHYGLWVSNDLTRGRSFECETFDNKLLSYKTDFEILKLEVWSIIDPYTGPKQPRKESFSVSENQQ